MRKLPSSWSAICRWNIMSSTNLWTKRNDLVIWRVWAVSWISSYSQQSPVVWRSSVWKSKQDHYRGNLWALRRLHDSLSVKNGMLLATLSWTAESIERWHVSGVCLIHESKQGPEKLHFSSLWIQSKGYNGWTMPAVSSLLKSPQKYETMCFIYLLLTPKNPERWYMWNLWCPPSSWFWIKKMCETDLQWETLCKCCRWMLSMWIFQSDSHWR